MSWLGCSCAQTQASHRRPSQRHGDGSTRGRSATLAQTAPREICPSQPPRVYLYNLRMDHHALAAVSITGSLLDVMGSIYLAYDLLGGQHGPLRLLTRAVTYSIVFGVGFGLGLGPFFGLASGLASGITLSIELNRAARGLDHYSLWWEGLFSAMRGFAFGAGLYHSLGVEYAAAFAVLLTGGQILAYSRGIRPALDYAATRKPRITRRHARAILERTLGYTATALLCSALVQHVD